MRDPAYLAEEAVEPARRAPAPPPVPGRVTTTTRLFPGALFRKARDANGVAAGAEDAVARAGSSGGAPLPGDVRGRFEQSLGADLSGVRVHTGAASADAAGAVGARAYALGNDIHFADGQYAPTDPFGLHLLAHEVAHTQQQAGSAARPQYKLEVSAPGDAAELEADRAADAMVAGTAAHVGSSVAGVARAGDPAAKAQAPAQAPTFVEFTTDGAWDAAHVLDQLGTLTSVPDDLKTAIQNGPKAAATFCVGLRERVTASDAADKATIASALTSRINELANATPQSPLQYGQLADVARWAAQHPPNAAPAAAAAAAPAAAGPGQAAAPEQTEGDKFRQQFLQSAQPGQAIMSQDDIDAANASHEGKGKVTTCILYAGDKYNAAIAGKQGAAKFLGPNAYKEANPAADLSAKTALPPGSWRDASDGMSERPKPGDMLVLDYAEATAIGDGDKKVMAQRGWFAHIDILQSIKAGEGDKPGEVWTTVDGGSTSSTQGDHQYDPATRTLTDRFGKRLLKGWFDVEKMAGY